MNRCVCAVVIEDLLFDLCLFEKQIVQYGDCRPQQQLLYVSDLKRCREPKGLARFLKEKFSLFGKILRIFVCPDDDGYAYPEGVIKFAFLSEAFAAELALDQYIVGKERLSVTTSHNILLSQCDLRARLREVRLRYESLYSSGFYNLSTSDKDPVINSIMNLHISSQNTSFVNESTLKNNQCPVNSNSYENVHNFNNTEACVAEDISKPNKLLNENLEVNNFSCAVTDNITVLTCTNSANVSSSHKSELSVKKLQDMSDEKDFKILKSSSFVNCDPDSHVSSKKTIRNRFNSNDWSVISQYYPSPFMLKNVSSLQNDAELKKKRVRRNSQKRKYHFKTSEKLSLKSQRIRLTQNSVESTNAKSEHSISSPSNTSVKSNKISCRNSKLYNSRTVDHLLSLPVDSVLSKVSNWLAYLPSSPQCISFISDMEQSFNTEVPGVKSVTNKKKCKNRISVYNTPLKSIPTRDSVNEINSGNSSIENEDPDEKTTILPKESFAELQNEEYHSPLLAFLKQELVSATNMSVITSQETKKSVIVCAAKSGDDIISVGCSHMTCEFCYHQPTELLLGYS